MGGRRTLHTENLIPIGIALAVGIVLAVILAPWSSDAAFPGQNGKIAFDFVPAGEQDTEIGTINPDGNGFARLTTNDVDDFEPAWSPDGQRITFSRVDFGVPTTEVWVMDANGNNQTLVPPATTAGNTLNPGPSPAFSGDGTQIAFIGLAPGGDQEVFVTNADGSGTAIDRTNTANFQEAEPTYAADNQRIAYHRGETVALPGGGNFDFNAIYTMQADGNGQTARTPLDGTVAAEGANFAPDGTLLTFARCDNSALNPFCFPHEVVTMSATGGPMTVLDPLPPMSNFEQLDPVFSPDGTRIAYVRQPDGPSDIYTVSSGGGTSTPLLTGMDAENPDWQPITNASTPSGGAAAGGGKPKKCRGVPVTIKTTRGNDIVRGTPGRDVVHGLRGNDKIYGFKGKDRLCGGRGHDRIFGGLGPDIMFGGDHADVIKGGPAKDRLFGGTPDAPIRLIPDTCFGGHGNDFERNCQRGD
jgi:hypothetical protein